VAFRRILLVGCSGSGKSTLARQIGQKLDLPVIHLDKLFWRDNWQSVSNEEFDSLLDTELNKECWIMDGNYTRTLSTRLATCDTVIYLDFPRYICLWNVMGRIIRNYGRTRPDVGGHNPERFDFEFIKWVWNFNRTHRQKYHTLLNDMPDKTTLILHNRKECQGFISYLSADSGDAAS
jgi:adenylate kinase family enzyme